MPVRPILQLGNPLLLQTSQPVQDFSSPQVEAVINDLRDTLRDFQCRHGYGRGIAAVQIGELTRIIFIRMQPAGFCGALINPVISQASDEQMTLWDDCFSFPDLLVQVNRSKSVVVDYFDETGQARNLHAEGDLSELLQHEIDHLDGILAIHRAVSLSAFATREEWQRRWQ